MAAKGKPSREVLKLEPGDKRLGDVFVEWDIRFKENVSTAQKNTVIKDLLKDIAAYEVKDGTVTSALKYHCFKCIGHERLYILRVYRTARKPRTKTATTATALSNDALSRSGPIRTPGPQTPQAPSTSRGGVQPVPTTEDSAFDGPIRTPGPPVPTAPSLVESLENVVGLESDLPAPV